MGLGGEMAGDRFSVSLKRRVIMYRASLCFLREGEQRKPVGVPDNAVHEVEVHQAEARHRRAQVKVNDILLADPP